MYMYVGSQFVILFFTFLSAFFSATETAILSSNSSYFHALANRGNRIASKLLILLDNPDKLITIVLVGNNVSNIGAASFITFFASKAFLLNDAELFLVTIAQTIFFLVFCELFPKIYARSNPESFLIKAFYILTVFNIILWPFIFIISQMNSLIRSMLHNNINGKLIPIGSRDEIDTLFKFSEKEGIIDSQHYIYLNEILSFKDVRVNEIMTPLIDIISVEKNQSIKSCISLIEKTRFSRIPVFEERVDNIIGYIYYQDILKNRSVKSLEEIIRPAYFVPSTKKVYDLINEMEKYKLSIVFVVNEYGSVEGLLTDEDIAEEIVGEIQTRDHPHGEYIMQIAPWKYSVAGKLDIEYFQRIFGVKIEKHDFETVAGFLLFLLGYFPQVGEKIRYQNILFQIEEATPKSIERVIVILPKRSTLSQS